MAPTVEISIPTTTLSTTPKPHTLYNITLRLPLRTYIVQKRYSEFTTLHAALISAAGNVPPPAPLPGKSWYTLTSTISNPALTEQRRLGLEKYLQTIATSKDSRWRDTSAWRSFLNLPSSISGSSENARESAHAAITRGGAQELSEPGIWLDVHREMKGLLHEARLQLGRRDSAGTAAGQHEAGANAKRCLVKAGCLITTLEEGLRIMSEAGSKNGAWGSGKSSTGLGAGEIRRRKDLLGSAKVEKEGLEKLSATLALKGNQSSSTLNGNGAATAQDKSALLGPSISQPRSGRVLGAPVPETNRTRELDNEQVLMLQRELMQEQDADVNDLAKVTRKLKDMGIAINEELEYQKGILGVLDDDVDRVRGKIDVAKKRATKIK